MISFSNYMGEKYKGKSNVPHESYVSLKVGFQYYNSFWSDLPRRKYKSAKIL